jgi:molybdenum cofactor cytidylyltransferase
VISAIVLAAGESKRMGQTKQLLEFRGKTILEHVLDNLLNSQVGEVILVLGHEAERIRQKVPAQKIMVVINRHYKEGMSTSIRTGLMAMDKKAEAFMVVLADQPAISKGIFNRLIQSFEGARPEKSIVLPTYRGTRGHPVLLGMKYKEEALRLKGDVGCRQILVNHPEDILEIEVDSDVVLYDIDTPEDYRDQRK